MNRFEEIENLKYRLYMLRQVFKGGRSRCTTPTQKRPKLNSRDVSPSRSLKLTPSSFSRQSEMPNTPSANTTSSKLTNIYNEKLKTTYRNKSVDGTPLIENKSKVQEIIEDNDKLQKNIGAEIDRKIKILGNFEESGENLNYLIAREKEKRLGLDKNLFLLSYVVLYYKNDNSNKAYIDRLKRDVENLKKRLYVIEMETAEVKKQDDDIQNLIYNITPLTRKVKNENTVLKLENKKIKQNVLQIAFKVKALKDKLNHNAVIVDTMHSDLKQKIMDKQKKVKKISPKI